MNIVNPDVLKNPIITIKEYTLKSEQLYYTNEDTDDITRYDGNISGRKIGSLTSYSYDCHGRLV